MRTNAFWTALCGASCMVAFGATSTENVQRALDVCYPGEGWKTLPVCPSAELGVPLVTHPLSETEPTGFVRTLRVEDRNRWLLLGVSSWTDASRVYDWKLIVRINGEIVHEEIVCSAQVRDIRIPLGAWAGKEIRLELLSAAGGADTWRFEYAKWHRIEIVEEFHPDWAKDLVIYEIATKSFNSLGGPERGTFKSVQEKLPYLQALGINAIWLTGSDLADSHHFYNIWTQYASHRPDRLDPSLGTHADLKALTDAAHARGIRIFLDVITHGVMNESSLVKEHPAWFKGGSWGMTDYNWKDRIPELDAWWVRTFTDYVLKDGIDGFRLDCGTRGRHDLWLAVKRNVWAAGREIAILPEGSPHAEGMSDACQCWHALSRVQSRRVKEIERGSHVWDVARYYGEEFFTDLDNWNARRRSGTRSGFMLPTIEISCHDNGWTGFPSTLNPYVTNGSRMLMGYSALLAPAIPILMMGEEFDADYVPVPGHCGELFGKDAKTPGRWLYGSWLQWKQLEAPRHRAMLDDTTRMLALRKRYASLLHARARRLPNEGICAAKAAVLPPQVPVPYVVYNRQQALLVAGNPLENDVTLDLTLPVKELGGKVSELRDVWSGAETRLHPGAQGRIRLTVPKDHQPRGGLAVYEVIR